MSLRMGKALSRRRTEAVGPAGPVSYFPPPRCEMTDEKEILLAAAISQIEKDHGKGAIMRLGSRDILVPVSVIPSGCLSIDAALGVGGFPRGRVIEIYGPESGGKTTMTLHVIAEAQKLGGQAAFIDAEHALDPVYARKLGVDVDNLLVSQPDNGEQALEIAETLIRSGGVDIVVVDSVAALVPKAELEGDMGDPQMGVQARGYSAHSGHQGRRQGGWLEDARESGEKQSGGAVPRGGIRHRLRRRDFARRRPDRSRRG